MNLQEIKALHPDWNLKIYSEDMNEIVNCANCGKEIKFGNGYTSLRHFSNSGVFGLPVCKDCYHDELEERHL